MTGDHLLGLVIGYFVGAGSMFVIALCAAASVADEASEELRRKQ